MTKALTGAKTETHEVKELPLWKGSEAAPDEFSSKLTMAKNTLNILQMQFKPALDGPALKRDEVCRLLDVAFELVRNTVPTSDHLIVLDIPVDPTKIMGSRRHG